MKLKWTKSPHPVFGKGKPEEDIHTMGMSLTFPKWQWVDDARKFSIVGKGSVLTIGMGEVYELYDLREGEVVGHYKTLKQAQLAAEAVILMSDNE